MSDLSEDGIERAAAICGVTPKKMREALLEPSHAEVILGLEARIEELEQAYTQEVAKRDSRIEALERTQIPPELVEKASRMLVMIDETPQGRIEKFAREICRDILAAIGEQENGE